MDSLKGLIDSRDYELVIKLTENSKNGSDLFYRIAAFTCLGKYEEALKVISDNQKILEDTNLASLVTIHIQLLCVLERYEEAERMNEYYQDLPYQSQVTEETLRKIPELIAQEKKKSESKFYSEDEVVNMLTSSDPEEVIFGLDLVKKRDVLSYLSYLSKILVNYPNQTVRSLTLMLLVEKEVDRSLNYLSYKGPVTVNPKKAERPFSGEHFNRILKIMDQEFKDTTLSQNGAQILSSFVIYIFPFPLNKDEETIAWAIYYEANKLISNEIKIDDIAKSHNLDLDKLNEYISLVDTALNDF